MPEADCNQIAEPVPNAKNASRCRGSTCPSSRRRARATNFSEVNFGYSAELARQEALRCLECAKPKLHESCPVGVKVSEFVQLIVAGDSSARRPRFAKTTCFRPSRAAFVRRRTTARADACCGKKGESLGIGYLERFVADYEQQHCESADRAKAPPTGKKVAIVGSGPSGLTAAGDLVQKGHKVHVFEALHEIGGVLVYGIPEFRLPKQIIREQVDYMRAMGVEFETDVVVGRTVTDR